MKRSAVYKYSLLKVGEIKNEGIFRVRLPAYIMNYLLLSFKMHLVIQTKYQIFWMNTYIVEHQVHFLSSLFWLILEHGINWSYSVHNTPWNSMNMEMRPYPVLLLCHTILAKNTAYTTYICNKRN
jgi:hypothetical protein